MCVHDPGVGEDLEQRVEHEEVARVLEQPPPSGIVGSDEPEVVGIARERRRHVLAEEPLVVLGERQRGAEHVAHEGLGHEHDALVGFMRLREVCGSADRPASRPRSARRHGMPGTTATPRAGGQRHRRRDQPVLEHLELLVHREELVRAVVPVLGMPTITSGATSGSARQPDRIAQPAALANRLSSRPTTMADNARPRSLVGRREECRRARPRSRRHRNRRGRWRRTRRRAAPPSRP